MKTNAPVIIDTISKENMEELLKETRETLAKEFLTTTKRKQSFGTLDLWRMQKKHKTLGSSTKW